MDSMDSSVNLMMKEKLGLAIFNDKKCKNKVLSVSKDFSKAIRKEIAVLKKKFRGKYLQNCSDHLKNIKPTSVELERAFSASGNFVTKLRSSLEDNTLNALCFNKEQNAHQENKV
jgi:hypothetical protein